MEEPVFEDLKLVTRADVKKGWHILRDMRFRENRKQRYALTNYKNHFGRYDWQCGARDFTTSATN